MRDEFMGSVSGQADYDLPLPGCLQPELPAARTREDEAVHVYDARARGWHTLANAQCSEPKDEPAPFVPKTDAELEAEIHAAAVAGDEDGDLPASLDLGLWSLLAAMAERELNALGVSEEESRRFLEDTGEAVYSQCPRCGKWLPHHKYVTEEGVFVCFSPYPDPCDTPECVAAAEEEERRAAEEKAREEDRKKQAEMRAQYEKNLHASGLGAKYSQKTFANYDVSNLHPTAVRARERCEWFVSEFDRMRAQGLGMFLMGPVGTGKTHLAASIVHALVDRGNAGVLFVSATAMLDNVRRTYSGEGSSSAVMDAYKTAPLLVIDDLGKEHLTSWGVNLIGEVIRERDYAGLPLVVTSNYTLRQLERRWSDAGFADQALATISRIEGATFTVQVLGSDWRRAHRG